MSKSTEILEEIETQLRKPETDKQMLLMQLKDCINVAVLEMDKEDGLTRGALGGVFYCLERLRKHWNQDGKAPSMEALAEIYADVELQRFDFDQDQIKRTQQHYRDANLLAQLHRVELKDGRSCFVLSSIHNQTTLDGRLIARGEMLESSRAPVPTFGEIVDKATNRGGQ